jgi:hypothetical protein
MRQLNISIAAVAVAVTVAMVVGHTLENLFGFDGATTLSLFAIAAVVFIAVLCGAPRLVLFLRLRRAGKELGLRPGEWVMPSAKASTRIAAREPWLYVAILQAADELSLLPGGGVERACLAFSGLDFQRLAQRSVYAFVFPLMREFNYSVTDATATDHRSLAERTAACIGERGADGVAPFFQALNVHDALAALESGLALEYAQQVFPVPPFIAAYSRA